MNTEKYLIYANSCLVVQLSRIKVMEEIMEIVKVEDAVFLEDTALENLFGNCNI